MKETLTRLLSWVAEKFDRNTSMVLLRYLRTPDRQEATVDAVADPFQWAVSA